MFYLGGVGPRVSMTGRAHPAARAAAPEPVSTTGFHLTTTGHTLFAAHTDGPTRRRLYYSRAIS
jgi:hypothetical protein